MKQTILPISAAAIKRIRALRKERRISAEALAELMTAAGYKVGRTAITHSELGYRKEISIDFVLAAAIALGVPVEVLLRDPECNKCDDAPPKGFVCIGCGKASA